MAARPRRAGDDDDAAAKLLRLLRADALVIVVDDIADVDAAEVCRRHGITEVPAVVVMVSHVRGRSPKVAVLTDLGRIGFAVGAGPKLVTGEVTGAQPDPRGEDALVGDGRVRVDMRRRVAFIDGTPINLPRLQFDLLAYLVARPGEAVARQQLLRDVWGFDAGGTATITVHVRELRRKIERDPATPVHLLAVRGVGYRFTP